MRSLTKGNVKTAISAVRRNKVRSMMTMLGIIIGVAPVIVIVSIGEGVRHQVGLQTNHLGKDLIIVRPGELLPPSGNNPLSNLGILQTGRGTMSDKDVTTVFNTPGVDSAVPLSMVVGGATSDENKQHFGALVIGTSGDFPTIINQKIDYGGFFSDSDGATNKVVIGSRLAEEMYNENVPLGQTMTILGQEFIVSGIFSDFQTTPLSIDTDFNNAVFMPYQTAKKITNGNTSIYEILARPKSPEQTDAVVARLNESLLAAHGGQHDFTVLKQDQTLEVSSRIIDLMTTLVVGVAAISLLVGSVGIMNIMLVSVTERLHEVGIRKAVGATNRQILNQFVIEAAVLSVTGAVLGILLALLVDVCLYLYTDLAPIISWQIVVITFLVSVGVGTLFGSVPALKAARKDPINALRNE